MERLQEDAKLREFLAIKKPRAQTKVWSNDDDQGLGVNVVCFLVELCLIFVFDEASIVL
jgi:hypothetical protein